MAQLCSRHPCWLAVPSCRATAVHVVQHSVGSQGCHAIKLCTVLVSRKRVQVVSGVGYNGLTQLLLPFVVQVIKVQVIIRIQIRGVDTFQQVIQLVIQPVVRCRGRGRCRCR